MNLDFKKSETTFKTTIIEVTLPPPWCLKYVLVLLNGEFKCKPYSLCFVTYLHKPHNACSSKAYMRCNDAQYETHWTPKRLSFTHKIIRFINLFRLYSLEAMTVFSPIARMEWNVSVRLGQSIANNELTPVWGHLRYTCADDSSRGQGLEFLVNAYLKKDVNYMSYIINGNILPSI